MRHNMNQTMNNSTEAQCNVYSLLEDSGKCSTDYLTLDLLNDSHYSEQQKLRQVLQWANSFLSNSEHDFSTAKQNTDLEMNDVRKNSKQEQISVSKIPEKTTCTGQSNSSYEKKALIEAVCNSEATKTVYPVSGHQKKSILSCNDEDQNVKLNLPQNITVYEQYKLCKDHLHRLKLLQSQKDVMSSKEETNQEESVPKVVEYNFSTDKNEISQCEVQKTELKYDNNNLETMDKRQDTLASDEKLPKNPRSCYRRNAAGNEKQVSREIEGSVQDSGDKGMWPRSLRSWVSEKSSSFQTNGRKLQRPRSSGNPKSQNMNMNIQTNSKRHASEVQQVSTYKNPYKSRAMQDLVDNYDHKPAGVALSWLSLPDELWLTVLSLLPLPDLLRVTLVCRRLHILTADHSLWRRVQIEKCSLTDWWFLCMGRRRPQTLCVSGCSGHRVTSCGLRSFFYLCRHSLQEVKVTGCTGAGLRGDLILSLIGQLCNNVGSVDVSWSGATDVGLKALNEGGHSLSLKEVVVNGCHITDEPLMDLLTRHKNSLCVLAVFGCQSITPSCLENIFEMCPNLHHLNIGQVRKVSAHSLTVMAMRLKHLSSLNVTGLQAVCDSVMDVLLQNCSRLRNLTLSSCPGVTDQTLNSISRHTPHIRSLDVSGCTAVTDAGVKSLALGCTHLQHLDLSSTATGNTGVILLANDCSRHLHTVKLSFCRISPQSILQLCSHCKRLKLLHLYSCPLVPTEKDIREVNSTVTVQPLSSDLPDHHRNIFKPLDIKHMSKR